MAYPSVLVYCNCAITRSVTIIITTAITNTAPATSIATILLLLKINTANQG